MLPVVHMHMSTLVCCTIVVSRICKQLLINKNTVMMYFTFVLRECGQEL